MAESFLEEQLKRIREMTEQVSRARGRAAENLNEMARHRESIERGPLQDVRDFRPFSPDAEELRDRTDDHGPRVRRQPSRDTSRRRR